MRKHDGTQHTAGSSRPAARRACEHDGFSLPEVLVAILLVGILAAVAIPSLLTTTTKATDVQAKELVHTAQNAADAYASDHSGSYAGISPAQLRAQEPTIATATSTEHAYLSAATSTEEGNGYTVTATAANGDELTLTRAADGTIARGCHSSKKDCSEGENGTW